MADERSHRLPRTVIPRRYQLEISPDLDEGTFSGTVAVEVDVLDEVREFILNSVNLTLDQVELRIQEAPLAGSVTYRPEDEQVVLNWPEAIKPGPALLSVHFTGTMSVDLRGLYRTEVKDSHDAQSAIASTQMEPTDARRVFPCWDEPDLKAVFQVALVVDEELQALSNARQVSTEDLENGKKRVTFAETIPMSTYLVALVVGPLELSEAKQVGEVPIRIAARHGFSDLTQWPLEEAARILSYFEDYFGISYPGDKLDHIGIPDFAAGAMENLGCITYREELLLAHPTKASPVEQLNVNNTIAHETAHMWFGDMVTMRWWNGLWLNEAFATFMSNVATDALHPAWDIWTQFGRGRDFALTVDALETTRAVEFPVHSPAEVSSMFDVLTYQKGVSILRMMEQYLSPEVFRQGIQRYLQKHRYANTDTSDLWDALEAASGQPVRSVMDSWVFQGGFPLIRAEMGADGRTFSLSQKQFRYRGEGHGRWKVPVVVGIRTANGETESRPTLIESRPVSVELPDDAVCVVVNQGGWGFFRVAYDAALWDRLMRYLSRLSPLERLAIVDDVWASVVAGEVSLTQAVALWRQLGDERDPDVWGSVGTSLAVLKRMGNAQDEKALARLVHEIARPVFEQIGWTAGANEDVRISRTRAVLVRILGTVGQDAEVQIRAHQLLIAHINGESELSADLLSDVVRVVAESGGETEWNLIHQQYQDPKIPQDESRYLYALSRFKHPDLIKRTMDFYLSPKVKTQDRPYAIGSSLMNRDAAPSAWVLVENNWDDLLKKCSPFMMEQIVRPLAYFSDRDLASRAIAWVNEHPVPEIARATAQTIEFQGINQSMADRLIGRMSELFAG